MIGKVCAFQSLEGQGHHAETSRTKILDEASLRREFMEGAEGCESSWPIARCAAGCEWSPRLGRAPLKTTCANMEPGHYCVDHPSHCRSRHPLGGRQLQSPRCDATAVQSGFCRHRCSAEAVETVKGYAGHERGTLVAVGAGEKCRRGSAGTGSQGASRNNARAARCGNYLRWRKPTQISRPTPTFSRCKSH